MSSTGGLVSSMLGCGFVTGIGLEVVMVATANSPEMGFSEWRELTALAALIVLCLTIGTALVKSNKELVLETKANTAALTMLGKSIEGLAARMVEGQHAQQERTDKAVAVVLGEIRDMREEWRRTPRGGA